MTQTGMSRFSGRSLGGDAHLSQSIADILTTPIGTRVMRRDYGSLLFDLIDQPDNARTRLRLFAAIAVALGKWEPRLVISRIAVTLRGPGALEISLDATRTDLPVGFTAAGLARLTVPLRF